MKQNMGDDDVVAEQMRIASMSKSEIKEFPLVLDGLTKYYKNSPVVKKVSFCVKKNECFGLLGVHGSGKTTVFKMLTGQVSISSGSAYVNGISVLTDMKKVYKEIGYCPGNNFLLSEFTGRDILHFFCLLRGIPKHRIFNYFEDLARSFGFRKYFDKATRTYSFGNKRKLSTAIAVIGNPSVIFLDEPTSGMDLNARRQLWNIVNILRDSGKSVVLTSQRMEECEVLCTHLTIMVNGELMCIGSVQHLKDKFSEGLTLKIKIKRPSHPTNSDYQLDIGGSIVSTNFSEKLHNVSRTDTTKRKSYSKLERKQKMEARNLKKQERRRISMEAEKKQLKEDLERVKEAIKENYPSAILQEEYQRVLTFYTPSVDIKWSEIFSFMEYNRAILRIEDFSISEINLEEIFLNLAQPERSSKYSEKEVW